MAPSLFGDPRPFRCPCVREGDDVDHVLTRHLDLDGQHPLDIGTEDNPFVRFRTLLHSYHVAVDAGLTDEHYLKIASTLDAAITQVDGRGFRTTPFGPSARLAKALGLSPGSEVWVKDETGDVAGSHKARHLMGILLHIEIVQALGLDRLDKPLVIASCGNAALAAAVLARASNRVLQVFIPPDAEPAITARLDELGAMMTTCPREAGTRGDPCYERFRAAVTKGSVPFCCQGPDNALTIQGGETLGYEMAWAGAAAKLDAIFVQVGGGALASACAQAFSDALHLGTLTKLPRFYAVQTRGCSPLARAYQRVTTWLGARLHLSAHETDAARAASLQKAVAAKPALLDKALQYAATHRGTFMWPWETEPQSVARAILDDETYDWLMIVRAMLESGGYPVVVDEEAIVQANGMARATTQIPVDPTGSAGLAGLLVARGRDAEVATGRVAVLFTGVDRHGEAHRR